MRRIIIIAVLLPLFFFAVLRAERSATYTNPVLVDTYEINRPTPAPYVGTLGIGDPAVIYHDGKYYLYPTGDNHSYDVYISDDLVHWTKGPKVFQSSERGVWAPDVFFSREDNMFYLYYTVNRRIGVASADRPEGVFQDRGALVSNGIDAHLFRDDDGSYFLYYARYPDFAIFVQPMESPLRKKGGPVQLLSPTEAWEMNGVPVIEAPWMIKHQGVYYLLYSGGSADSEHYAIGYATAKHPLGPFTKYRGNPIIQKGDGIFGPGHPGVVRDQAGKLWMVYHQQKDETRGWNRIICIDPLWIDGKGILHGKASRGTPQPAPVTVRSNK
ncbi:MAG: glycoside hydrolase family 43 protein [Nitrospirota bacterium]|nr:glycoside hydrolase family 43 protein [Nitrospirota bacterium]